MSLSLTLVALIEVGGLAAIAFLVLNLENLSDALLDVEFVALLLNLLKLSEDTVLFLFAGLIISYSLLTIVISTISIRRMSIFSGLMGAKIKTSLLKHFLSLGWLDFLKSNSSKNMSRIINDGDIVADMISFIMNLFNKLILALIITTALFIFNPLVTLGLTLILSTAYLLIFSAFKSQTKKNSLQITKYTDIALEIITNVFGSFKEIIFYNNQKKAISNFEQVDSNLATLKGINMSLAYMPRFYIDAALLMILIMAAIFVSYYGISASSFFATLSVYGLAALKLLPAFQNIFYFSYEIFARLPHLNNVTALLAQDAGNNLLHSPGDPLQFKNEISFKNISFAYEKDQKNALIEKIDLTMRRGQKIAIVGPTGSGKSTFLDLLLGMIEPDSGEITMDQETLSKKNLHSYRRNFSYVPQKIFFIEDTLQENIVFGSKQELDIDKLDRVILNASLQELIDDLPNGLQTNISDSNQMVSGGQKQCIGIARALYRGGDILILDEATSGMDQALEKKIYEAAFDSQFQTFISVTHKSSLLDKFDKIFVFNDGCIEAIGSYEELKKTSNFFNSMLNQPTN
ncbi:ABC transporter ATP-binding protein/permease [Gammaproteobacteria bacterium]|nr:ABC transporter ATP-binding protein/permease [Gammaproteobacteria bacterium]